MLHRTQPTQAPRSIGPEQSGNRPAPVGPPARGQPDPWLAAIPTSVVFLAGLWLVIAPFTLDYSNTGLDGYWNDVVIGIAIVLVSSIRLISPPTTSPWSLINIVLGAWLLIAPFALGYHEGPDAPTARWNDMVVGLVVVALAATSWWLTRRATRQTSG